MKRFSPIVFSMLMMLLMSCATRSDQLKVEVYETSAAGNKLTPVTGQPGDAKPVVITLLPENRFQTITGFGGSFTEASAYLLNKLSKKNRDLILEAYFSTKGARYSLTRTHISSCDFSLGNYTYAPVPGDKNLVHFSIDEDREDIIPMIKDAMAISEEGFKIVASPWTAPPWMKTNKDWRGGKLLPEYYDTWALFFSKYLSAYKKEGIDIWGITVENEPLGCGDNWESMIYTADEMVNFVNHHLGPRLEADKQDVKVFAYDQNRGEALKEWAKTVYKDSISSRYFDGLAIHWYGSTIDWFPESLNFAHEQSPDKHLIQTEACIDAEVPHWQEDTWYWSEEATDWGWDWAPENEKALHPKYVPVYRYARDIIGCLNNWVDGWIDWNMVLDRQGGPNWFKNWCVAPVIVDPEKDEVYFTPLYYTMAHFSKFIRPGAVRIGLSSDDPALLLTAARNPDGSIAVVVLNTTPEVRRLKLMLNGQSAEVSLSGRALQTILIPETVPAP